MAHGFFFWAGTVAAIGASVAATGVTATFGYFQHKLGKSQRDIAKSQRDIARENLKADLFDRRMEVYSAARSVCLYIGRTRRENADFYLIRNESAPMENSTFLFRKEIANYIINLREKMMTYASNALTFSALQPESEDYAAQLAESQKLLKEIVEAYNQLPILVSPDMQLLPPEAD